MAIHVYSITDVDGSPVMTHVGYVQGVTEAKALNLVHVMEDDEIKAWQDTPYIATHGNDIPLDGMGDPLPEIVTPYSDIDIQLGL